MGVLAERQRPLRRSEFERMIAAGLFRDEQVELIRGVIVRMSPQNPPHSRVIQVLNRLLMPALVGRADVRVQLPLAVSGDSLPEPDLAVVATDSPIEEHPAKAFLVVEVSDSTLEEDRHEKGPLYAEAGIAEYWIANVRDRAIEVHTDPVRGAYTRVTPFREGETVRLTAFSDVIVSVAAVFGR